jgi:parvulin-like peptidyl-prolyl isomerase
MGKESKIRELRRARIIPAVKSAKITKPMARGWKITIWSILIVGMLLVVFGIWAYTKRNVEAVAGGYAITTQDVEERAFQMLQQSTPPDQFNPNTPEFQQQFEQAKQSVISMIINEKIFLRAGEVEGIEVTEEDITKAIDDILKNQIPQDPALLNNWLKDNGFNNLDEMKKFVKDRNLTQLKSQILTDKLFAKEDSISKVNVTEDEAKSFYNGHGELKISHILFSYDPAKDAAEMATKKSTDAEALRKEVLKDPTKFSAIAKEKSEDPTAKNNSGDLDWYSIKDGQLVSAQGSGLVPEFNDASLMLKKGEISPVVQTQYGFHIIKLDDVKTNSIKFDQTEGARIGVIKFVTINSSGQPLSDAEKKAKEAKANALLADLKAGKIPFEKAVNENSEDQITKGNKGELPNYMATDATGFFWANLEQAKQSAGQGSYPFEPAVIEAVWNLKNGQLAPKIVATANEYVIVKLIEKRMSKKMTFDEVKKNVIEQLKSERKSKAQNDWMTKKREELGVSMGNPWKSFSTWWQSNIVAPFEDFGAWFGKLMGKGASENVTTSAPSTTPAGAENLPTEFTPEMLQQLQQQQGGGQQPPPGNNP